MTGRAIRLWSEKFGVDVWLVSEPTEEDRLEFSLADWGRVDDVADAFGGEVVALESADGTRFEATRDWQDRARRRRLLDMQIHYDTVLDREQNLARAIDDPETAESERRWLSRRHERELTELNRLIQEIEGLGHAMTDEQIGQGFEAALRWDRYVAPTNADPTPESRDPEPPDGRDDARRRRLLDAVARLRDGG